MHMYTLTCVFVDCSWSIKVSTCMVFFFDDQSIVKCSSNTLVTVYFLTDPWRICSCNSHSRVQIPCVLIGEWTSNSTLKLKVGFLTFTHLLLNLFKANKNSLPFFSAMIKNMYKVTVFPLTLFGFLPTHSPPHLPPFSILTKSATCYVITYLVIR